MSEQKKPPPETKKEAETDRQAPNELSEEALEKVAGGVAPLGDSSDPQEGGEGMRRR
jgi:hypothetical protein